MSATVIHVFGNPDIVMDSLPLRILPNLQERFPNIVFRKLDPNEEWEIPDVFVLVDSVMGLSELHVFNHLDEFSKSPTVSMHDFDALFNLRYLAKLGKLKHVRVIGVPPEMNELKAFCEVSDCITKLFPALVGVQLEQ